MATIRQHQSTERSDEGRIWEDGSIRLFISHNAQDKALATELKRGLRRIYDVDSFVAHEDIAPTDEWQNSILVALASMDILIVLLTDKTYPSKWIDQEIGYALGQDAPVVPIRLGTVPHGFVGKYQALNGIDNGMRKSSDQIAFELFELMLTKSAFGLKDKAWEGFTKVVRSVQRFKFADRLVELLYKIDSVTPEQLDNLIEAYNINDRAFSPDLVLCQVNRLSPLDKTYGRDKNRKIAIVAHRS